MVFPFLGHANYQMHLNSWTKLSYTFDLFFWKCRLTHLLNGCICHLLYTCILKSVYFCYHFPKKNNLTIYFTSFKVGKGRDVGLNQIALFEGKVAGGNGEQVLSRDVYRLGQLFDFFRMLTFFFTTVGYYVCTMVTPRPNRTWLRFKQLIWSMWWTSSAWTLEYMCALHPDNYLIDIIAVRWDESDKLQLANHISWFGLIALHCTILNYHLFAWDQTQGSRYKN